MPNPKRDDGALSAVMIEILVTLSRGPLHGYAIKQDIEDRIGGDFILGSGSLYQAIQRLERRGLIAEARADTPDDARRGRSYRIQSGGRKALQAELARMSRILKDARVYTAKRPREV